METGWLSEISLISLQAFRSVAIFRSFVRISFLWFRSQAVLGFLTEKKTSGDQKRGCVTEEGVAKCEEDWCKI